MMKRHYEKVIVACGFLFVFVNLGLASTAFSVHQPYIVDMEGVGDTGGALMLSARTLTSFIAMFFVDRYYAAFDVRRGVLFANLSVFCGFMVFSVAQNLPTLMIAAVFMGLGYGLGGAVAMTFIASRWFESGIGTAVGIAAMGSGFASVLAPLLVVRIVEASSLSTAFLVEGGITLATAIVVFAFLRNRPSDMGLEPYRSPKEEKRSLHKHHLESAPVGERRLLLASMACVGIFCCCGITYLSVLATSTGYDYVFAAALVSIAGISLTIAKFIAGELFDRLGAPRASTLLFAIAAIGFALCSLADTGNPAIMVAGAIAVGSGLSLGTVGLSVWSIELSEPKALERQVKNNQVAYAFGGFIANTLPGIVKDLVGSYVVSYAATVAIVCFAAIVILRFYRLFTTSEARA